MTEEERYSKEGNDWKIVFKRTKLELTSSPEAASEAPLVQELINRGITSFTARELAQSYPPEFVGLKIEVFDWLVAKKDKRVSKNPPGYLTNSIRNDYKTPAGFESKERIEAKRLELERAEEELKARRNDVQSRHSRELEERAEIDNYLASLTSEQRTQLEQEAIAGSDLEPRFFRNVIVRDHVRKVLGMGG